MSGRNRSSVDEMQPAPEAAGDAAPDTPAAAETTVPDSVRELEAMRQERDRLQDRLLRALAEFDNFRKRAQKENSEARVQGAIDMARAFLPVLDNFTRAQSASGGVEELRQGIALILKQWQDGARRAGLETISAQGQPFDPHWHEAIETVERDDVPDHTVVEELQTGYRLRDRLVRPAMVKVSRKP